MLTRGSSSKEKSHEDLERQKRLTSAIDMEDISADEAEANAAIGVSGAPTTPSETSSKLEPEPAAHQQPQSSGARLAVGQTSAVDTLPTGGLSSSAAVATGGRGDSS